MNSVEQNRSIAAGMLLGGLTGAGIGAKFAPNVLGKVDVDRALTHTPYTDIVRDKISKLGEAERDLFVTERDKFFINETWINDVYQELLPGNQKKVENYIGMARPASSNEYHYEVENRKSSVTGKELKELLQDKNNNFSSNGERIAKIYKDAIEKLPDDKVLNSDDLKRFMKENSDVYKTSKKTITEFLNSLPKQRSKYALIVGTVGALIGGAIACILAPINNKNL